MHRDVKPQNVLLDAEGSAKVTDFGIARSLRDDGLTADGRVLGTTDYVSPEQALGHDVDGQSDIYSLGVVLYEMLTGDVPFHGENQISVAMKHVREDLPDIQRIRPEVCATTAAVLDRMTDKDLAHRYADVPSLVADLEDALALEAARQGTSTGEATAVIRTLPARARRRLPFRMRHSLPLLGIIGLIAVAVAIIAHRLARGPAARRERHRPRPARAVHARRAPRSSRSRAARPTTTTRSATTRSTPRRPSRVVDRDDGTAWSTESYQDGLEGAGKKGVGIYIDAKPKVAAVSMQIDTPAARASRRRSTPPRPAPSPKSVPEGWTKVGGGTVTSADKRFKLDTGGTEYRYYLVWITKLAAGRRQRRDLRDPALPGSRAPQCNCRLRGLSALRCALESDRALGLEALDRQRQQPVAQRRERQPGASHSFG